MKDAEEQFGGKIPPVKDPLARLVHGSDHPIPITPWSFAGRVPASARREATQSDNALQTDVALKRAAGLPDACLTRLASIVASKMARACIS